MKMTNFNKLMQIINVIGNMPQVAQALNPVKFVQRIFESFDESPDDLLNMDMLQKQADLVQQQMDAAQQPGAEMGGVPVGPEGRVPQEEMSPEQLQEVINNVKGTNANGNREPRQ